MFNSEILKKHGNDGKLQNLANMKDCEISRKCNFNTRMWYWDEFASFCVVFLLLPTQSISVNIILKHSHWNRYFSKNRIRGNLHCFHCAHLRKAYLSRDSSSEQFTPRIMVVYPLVICAKPFFQPRSQTHSNPFAHLFGLTSWMSHGIMWKFHDIVYSWLNPYDNTQIKGDNTKRQRN